MERGLSFDGRDPGTGRDDRASVANVLSQFLQGVLELLQTCWEVRGALKGGRVAACSGWSNSTGLGRAAAVTMVVEAGAMAAEEESRTTVLGELRVGERQLPCAQG